jgi:hypothetical protein
MNRSKDDIERTLSDIRQLKNECKTDKEIMESLKIPLSTYHRYTSKIHKEDKKAWLMVSQTQLEPELLSTLS